MSARYFRGQAPSSSNTFNDDDSDDDDVSSPTQPSQPPQQQQSTQVQPPPRRRPRITARVIPAQSHPQRQSSTGNKSGFVLVKSLASRPSESHPSRSSSSDSDDQESDSSSYSSGQHAPNDTVDEPSPEPEQIEINNQRPVFIRQDLRAKQQKQLEEGKIAEQRQLDRGKQRQQEAQRLVTKVLEEEERRRDHLSPDDDLPDDSDKPELHDADHAVWKVRELLRIKRDRDEQTAWENRTTSKIGGTKPESESESNQVNISNDDDDINDEHITNYQQEELDIGND